MFWIPIICKLQRNFPKLKQDNKNKRNREEAHMTQEVKEEEKEGRSSRSLL